MTTQSLRRQPLSRALQTHSDVVVDLSELSYADPSLMIDLAMVSRRLRRHGGQMRVHGARGHVHDLIKRVGLHRLPGISVE